MIVSLRASEEGDVTLAVSDTGPGVPNSERKNIFDRFYRADNGMTRETTGAGIGLSIVKHIVEAHGGTITVASREGGGAVFEVTLKRKKDDVQ